MTEKITKDDIKFQLDTELTQDEIAQALGISREKLYYLCRKYGIKAEFQKRKMKKTEHSVLEAYYLHPASALSISRNLSVGYGTVIKIFKKYGLKKGIHNKKHFNVLNDDSYANIISELKNTSKPLSKIASTAGVSRQRIHQIQKKNCITRIKKSNPHKARNK